MTVSSNDALPVVLVHFRAPEWCRGAVEAVTASEGMDVDVVVADNSGELAAAGDLPCAVVATGRNLGYAGGANAGLRVALERNPAASFVAVCAHDFHPDPTCFRQLVDHGAADPSAGVLAPRLTAPKPDIGHFFDGRRSRRVEPSPTSPELFEPDWVSGTCMLVRTEVLRAVGGFDEGFGSYMEDVDLCLRVREAGWRVVTVTGASGRGLGSVSEVRHRLTAVNVALLAAKREGAAAAWRLVARYVGRAARSLLLALAPSPRALDRRKASLRYAGAQAGAAWDLLCGRRIGIYARDPGRFQAAFDPGVPR